MDGVEATRQIRKMERDTGRDQRRKRAVIFGLTGSCEDKDLVRYNEAGMDGCIEKGCIVARAIHEALAIKQENPNEFVFINSRNVHILRTKSPVIPDDVSSMDQDESKMVIMSPTITPRHDRHAPSSSPPTRSPLVRNIDLARSRSPSSSSSPSPVLHRKKYSLLVDDVTITQKLTSAALHRTGYTCDQACDGQQAVELAKLNSYAVILMDVQLPVLDGVEATRQIRAYEREIGVVEKALILGLTGSCGDDALRLYAEAGMDGCIEKGCVVSRAMHEAIALKEENPNVFLFIDAKNVQFRLLDNNYCDMDAPGSSSEDREMRCTSAVA